MHTSHFSHKRPLKQLKKRKHIWVMPWLIDFILAKNCLIFDEKSYIDIGNTKKITVNGITTPPLDSKGSRLMGSQLHLLIVKDHG
jgi:hypothetical protein